MKPRIRKKMSNAPMMVGTAIFGALIAVIWLLSGGHFFAGSQPGALCGHVIQESLTLSEDLFCPADSMGLLPRGQGISFSMLIQTDGVVLDCAGHGISGEGGVGILIEDAGDVTVRNCTLAGQDVALSATGAIGLTVESVRGSPRVGGIEILNSRKTTIANSVLTAGGDESQWGVQVVGGEETRVVACEVSGFHYGGIHFYGSKNFSAEKNRIFDIGDTGIGFFQQTGYPANSEGRLVDNRIEGIRNVGAFEVMHGARNLTIANNRIVNCKSALFCYEKGVHGPVRDILFADNRVDGSYWPFHLTDCESISIQRNEIKGSSGGGLATAQNAAHIAFLENHFIFNNGPMTLAGGVEDFTFTKNRFSRHFGSFLRLDHRPEKMNLAENGWDGCPTADRFTGIRFPEDLNPVLLVEETGEHLVTLVDSNGDGVMDPGCDAK